jgi:A/G-specific adenine glycosylase
MALWSGLGYYSRARNLHAAARACVQRHGGELPADFDALLALPGIGRSTAGAILAQAHGLPFPILDGNVRRVLARWAGIEGWPGTSAVQKRLWEEADHLLPDERLADYTQALMDLGATVCTRHQPGCGHCPLRADCIARRDGRTDELPTARPRKTIPHRACLMLLAFDAAGRVLLRHRHGAGVWQGLWSLPQADDLPALRQLASQRLRPAGDWQALTAFEHAFSHYRLEISPWLLRRAQPRSLIEDDAGWRWLDPSDLGAIGLPAPVRKLILSHAPT